MKRISLSEVKDDLSRYLHLAEDDPQFLERIDKARSDIRAGKGIPLEEIAK